MKYDLILIDGDNVAFKNFYAQSKLTFNGLPTGLIYGFLNSYIKLVNQFKTLVWVTWGDNNSQRKEIYSEYKAHRSKEGREDYFRQLKLLQQILSSLGVTQIKLKNKEADDAIFSIVNDLKNQNHSLLIVSEDKDLLQLVGDRCHQLKRDKIYDYNEVFNDYKVFPEFIPLYLALVGDKSDNIIGVEGIGKKRAAMLINQYGEYLLEVLGLEKIETKDKWLVRYFENKEKIILNLKLTNLKYLSPGSPSDNLLTKKPDKNMLIKLVSEQGITSILDKLLDIYREKYGN